MVKPMVEALSVAIRRGKDVYIGDIGVALVVSLITPAPMWIALLVVMRRRASHREGWHMVARRHLCLRREMHIYTRCVNVWCIRAGGPLHRIIWGVGMTGNRRGVRSGRGWCRLCHGGKVIRRWSGSVTRFWAVALVIRVVAVFGRIENGFNGGMGTRGLGQGSREIRRSRRLYHSIGVIHSSSRGWIRLHVSIRWIPVVVVHRVGIMWVAPGSGRIVSMVGIGNKGGLLPRRGRLRSCRNRSGGFQRSDIVLMNCGVRVW